MGTAAKPQLCCQTAQAPCKSVGTAGTHLRQRLGLQVFVDFEHQRNLRRTGGCSEYMEVDGSSSSSSRSSSSRTGQWWMPNDAPRGQLATTTLHTWIRVILTFQDRKPPTKQPCSTGPSASSGKAAFQAAAAASRPGSTSRRGCKRGRIAEQRQYRDAVRWRKQGPGAAAAEPCSQRVQTSSRPEISVQQLNLGWASHLQRLAVGCSPACSSSSEQQQH